MLSQSQVSSRLIESFLKTRCFSIRIFIFQKLKKLKILSMAAVTRVIVQLQINLLLKSIKKSSLVFYNTHECHTKVVTVHASDVLILAFVHCADDDGESVESSVLIILSYVQTYNNLCGVILANVYIHKVHSRMFHHTTVFLLLKLFILLMHLIAKV